MGNYGRFEDFVDRYDPYGYQQEVAKRLMMRRALESRPQPESITDINAARRQAQYDQDLKNEMADKQEMHDRGENEYEQSLDKRGLLNTDIVYNRKVDYGDRPGQHPATVQPAHLKVHGKIDPATAALLKQLAEEGLVSGDTAWTNTAQNRTALAALLEGRKADSIREQSRVDAEKAQAAELASREKMAGIPLEAERMREAHDIAMMKAKQEAAASDPNAQLQRDLTQAQIQHEKTGLARADAEYVSPEDASFRDQARALAPTAMSGDPQAFAALQRLAAGRKIGMDVETYRPTIQRVLAQPEIAAELASLSKVIDAAGGMPGTDDIARAKAHAARAIEMAGQFGDGAKAEVARLIMEHAQKPSTAGTIGTALIPFVGPLLAARRAMAPSSQGAFMGILE